MNMGAFRGSEYAGDGFSCKNTMQFLRLVFSSVQGIQYAVFGLVEKLETWKKSVNAADRDQITELLAMPELQAGFATLAQNLPGFQSFVDSMLPPTEEPATTTTEAAGMVRH